MQQLALGAFQVVVGLAQRLGLGRLPGDFKFKLFGRDWFIPLASTVLLSFVVSLIAKWV